MIRLIVYVAIVFFYSPINAQNHFSDSVHKVECVRKASLQPLSNEAIHSQSLMSDSDLNNRSSCFKNMPLERLQNVLRRVASYFTELANTFYGFYGLNR